MSEMSNQIGLAYDFLRIHRAITRGLKVTIEKGSEFVKNGFPSPELKQGYALYIQALTIIINAHHLSEDEIAFPALKEKLPAVPFDNLSADHAEIVILLDQISQSLLLVTNNDDMLNLERLVDAVREIYGIWGPHIRVEEWNFTKEAFDAAMDQSEQAQLGGLMSKHGQDHAIPPFLALPFVLFNLEQEDRAATAANMPPIIMQELIPITWKDQWAPMKPFLLE
jgi:hypothetical protein